MDSPLEWNDLSVLLAVCRTGSLSGAARALGQTHSTIFRKVNAIEDRTGVRFFERLPTGYGMTDAGRTALAYAERIESEVHAFGREILGQDMRLGGRITLTAPEGLSMGWLPRMIARFRAQHPEVSVDIIGSHAASDLARREADLAIRATRKPPDASLGRRVCAFRFAFYASPGYLEAHGDRPLLEQDFCMLPGALPWLVPLLWKKKEQGERSCVFTGNSTLAVVQAAVEGMGVTLLPCYVGDEELRLVRTTAPLEPLTLELWLLTHPDLRHTARVKALMAFMAHALGAEAKLFEGAQPHTPNEPLFRVR